jgi:hypothetical protein
VTESEFPSGEEDIDESGRNPTQERLDSDTDTAKAADASWREEEWGETADQPHEGEEGQESV